MSVDNFRYNILLLELQNEIKQIKIRLDYIDNFIVENYINVSDLDETVNKLSKSMSSLDKSVGDLTRSSSNEQLINKKQLIKHISLPTVL
jgi:hypothetical protein